MNRFATSHDVGHFRGDIGKKKKERGSHGPRVYRKDTKEVVQSPSNFSREVSLKKLKTEIEI